VSFPKISPNLLIGVGGIIAAVFLVNEIRKAGGDLQNALSGIELPSIGDITFPEINFPEFKFPNIFGEDDSSSQLAGETVPFGGQGSTITIPQDTIVNPDGTVTSSTPPLLDLSDAERDAALIAREQNLARTGAENILSDTSEFEFGDAEIIAARNEAEFRARQQEQIAIEQEQELGPAIVETTLDQEFIGGGPSFIGGIIRENPIDTLSEVINLFPGITASQASDFLRETGGSVLPSEIDLIDQNIKNIVASIAGENVQVGTTSISDLESEANRAACISCQMFGLNCDICRNAGGI